MNECFVHRISGISFTFCAQHDTSPYSKLEWLDFLFTLHTQRDAPTYTSTTHQCGACSGSPQFFRGHETILFQVALVSFLSIVMYIIYGWTVMLTNLSTCYMAGHTMENQWQSDIILILYSFSSLSIVQLLDIQFYYVRIKGKNFLGKLNNFLNGLLHSIHSSNGNNIWSIKDIAEASVLTTLLYKHISNIKAFGFDWCDESYYKYCLLTFISANAILFWRKRA